MRHEVVNTDLTVIGGGLSGVCAAIAAARLGRRVALVQNRPVLGGNSSSEVRVWVGGANGLTHNRYARESGIIGELLLENQYRNQEGNPYIWDVVVLEAVKAEPNIELFLNTDVREVDASGPEADRSIHSVTGWMMASERLIRFESPLFLDCSGDALVGFLAGARHRMGREGRAEFGEIWAPEQPDIITLGSTIFFYTKDAGHPVPFVRPSFARDIATTTIPLSRILSTGDSGAKYWWIEFGGELDTLHDDAKIRDELWSAVYGIWDYIKNSGRFDADTLTLEWVGALPGKRESRRLIGDHILTQNDVIEQRPFDDRVAFGGWMVDLHPPKGMYTEQGAAANMYTDGVFHIPYRCLYSANVSNLLFAGRNISTSHAGFGATRVMATCAAMGEAAGTAAALCLRNQATPRALGREHLAQLQQQLLRQDAPVVGVANQDPEDQARFATLTASSWRRLMAVEDSAAAFPLQRDIAFVLPVDPELSHVDLLVDAESTAEVRVELWDMKRAENYVPHSNIATTVAAVEPGRRQWVRAALPWRPSRPCNACVIVRACAGVSVHVAAQGHTGTLAYVRKTGRIPNQFHINGSDEQPPLVLEWDMKELLRQPVCFRAAPETRAFAPAQVTNGFARPYGSPNLWVSAPLAEDTSGEAWIELDWDAPRSIGEVCVTFNDDVNEHLNNLHKFKTAFRLIPELVKDYRIEARRDGHWSVLFSERDNRRRRRNHRLPAATRADALRLVVEATHGGPCAEIFEIRVY